MSKGCRGCNSYIAKRALHSIRCLPKQYPRFCRQVRNKPVQQAIDPSVISWTHVPGGSHDRRRRNFPMPEEERNQMHAIDPNTGKNKPTEETTPACVYSLDTLMALQKLLENGIPQPGERMPHSPQRRTALESKSQNSRRPVFVQPMKEPQTTWREYLRRVFMKLRGMEEAYRGNSAQQNG